MTLKLYVDPVSQPARAVMLFVRANKIPVEEITMSLMKGEHKTPEYARINRFQTVPAIVHDSYHLAESVAILRYLSRVFPSVPDHWYPKDLQAQARVDEYMSWQHIGLRIPITLYTLSVLRPERLGPNLPTPSEIANYRAKMDAALTEVETKWFDNSDFIAGNEISIADLMAVGEIEMTRLTDTDATAGRPKIAAYLKRVKETIGPEIYDEVHAAVYKYQELTKSRAQ